MTDNKIPLLHIYLSDLKINKDILFNLLALRTIKNEYDFYYVTKNIKIVLEINKPKDESFTKFPFLMVFSNKTQNDAFEDNIQSYIESYIENTENKIIYDQYFFYCAYLVNFENYNFNVKFSDIKKLKSDIIIQDIVLRI